MYMMTIRGRVGDAAVNAFVYPGADSGLSYYKIIDTGKQYFGTVQFTEIYETRRKKY